MTLNAFIFRTCLQPAQIILLRDQPERCVIEIDVEPTFDVCRNEIFFIRRGKKGKQDLYVRQGTMTQGVTQKDRDNFCNVVAANAKERKRLETKLTIAQGGSSNIDTRLNHTVCQGMPKLHDTEYQVGFQIFSKVLTGMLGLCLKNNRKMHF